MARRSRRKKQSVNPTPIILGIVVALAVAAGAYFFLTRNKGIENSAKKFPVDIYLKDSISLRNNIYEVRGEIAQRHSEQETSEMSVVELQVDGTASRVMLFIPNKLTEENSLNLSAKDRYIYTVKVDKAGLLEVEAIRRE